MKRIVFSLLTFLTIVLFFDSCKKEETTDFMVYWSILSINESNPVNQEMNQIYTSFDNAFSKSGYGSVQNHSIFISSIPVKQLTSVNSDLKRLAAQADESLQDFSPTSYYAVTITTTSDGKTATLATYYYEPKEPGDNGDNNGDGDGNGDDNNGDGNGDGNGDDDDNGNGNGDDNGDEYAGDGIVDETSVLALKPLFYAPLTSDLIDRVSGTAGLLYGSLGTYSDQGLSFNHNRILWTSGRWNNITYSTPFTLLADYKRTGSNNEHMHIVNTSPGPGVTVERGLHICCREGQQNNLITSLLYHWVDYGVTSPNTCQINTQHILTGFSYDGNGHITRIQDGVITTETYTISPDKFPDMLGTVFCIGGLHNYNRDYWIGTIGNVMLFDRVLNQMEITSMQ